MTHPRLQDVAARAGVSVATVSRVINDKPAVGEDLRGRVLQAISELGYRPNPAARSLRSGRDDTIGVVVEDVSDPFFGSVVSAIEQVASARGAMVIVAASRSTDDESTVRAMLRRHVAGLILSPSEQEQQYVQDVLVSTPVVYVDRMPHRVTADSVTVDNHGGGWLAARHLLELGHRRIAFLGSDRSMPTVYDRYRGFVTALGAGGIEHDEALTCWTGADPDAAAVEFGRFLDAGTDATAVFSSGARSTIGALRALRQRGRRDLGLVAFDDLVLADALDPPLTVVDQDPRAIGRLAAERLFARIRGEQPNERHQTVPLRLVVRGSGRVAG
jgi:LacI family transcriptional regulator